LEGALKGNDLNELADCNLESEVEEERYEILKIM
jgi:hypothetical protein